MYCVSEICEGFSLSPCHYTWAHYIKDKLLVVTTFKILPFISLKGVTKTEKYLCALPYTSTAPYTSSDVPNQKRNVYNLCLLLSQMRLSSFFRQTSFFVDVTRRRGIEKVSNSFKICQRKMFSEVDRDMKT
jgi:hypothetical protein